MQSYVKSNIFIKQRTKKDDHKNIKGRKKSAVNLKLQNMRMFINRQF